MVSNYGWLVAIALQLVIVWGVWSARRAFASKEEVQALANRQTVLEIRYESVPTSENLRRIYGRIDGLAKDLTQVCTTTAETRATVAAMKTTVDILHSHHLGEST